jgi:hypothetical protein
MSIDTNTTEITIIVSSIISFFISYIGLWNTDCKTHMGAVKWSHVFFLIWLAIVVLLLIIFYMLVKWFRIDNDTVNTTLFSLGIVIPIIMIITVIARTAYQVKHPTE